MKKENYVELFNRKFPPGSQVQWRPVASSSTPFRKYTVRYKAEDFNGQAVAWFKERTGLVGVEPGYIDYG